MRRFSKLLTACLTACLSPSWVCLPVAHARASQGAAQDARRAGAGGSVSADSAESEMRPLIELYAVDRGSLLRTYPFANSPARQARLTQFYRQWLDTLSKLDFDSMGLEGRVDYVL